MMAFFSPQSRSIQINALCIDQIAESLSHDDNPTATLTDNAKYLEFIFLSEAVVIRVIFFLCIMNMPIMIDSKAFSKHRCTISFL